MTRAKGKARARANKKKRNVQKSNNFLRKKSLLSEIRKWDDPILEAECEVVPDGEDVKSIFKKMKYVLNASDNGVGLASSQIGIAKRIVIIKPNVNSSKITCMVNPEIISHSEKMKFGRESCLSYPGISGIIERYVWVEIKYYDEEWKEHIKKYEEMNARIVSHEIDHILGKCQVYDWWKNPEEKQKELEERFREQEEVEEEQEGGYEVVESEDLKKEKADVPIEDIDLLPIQEKMVEVIEESSKEKEEVEECDDCISQESCLGKGERCNDYVGRGLEENSK